MTAKFIGPFNTRQGLLGATLVNAQLIFDAGKKSLPNAGKAIGARGVSAAKSKIDIPGPPRSKPGEPPKVATSALLNSIRFTITKSPKRGSAGRFTPSRGAVRINIIADTPYAKALEFGTSRVAARPYFTPTFQNKGFATFISKTVSHKFVTLERFAAGKGRTGGLRG